MISLFNNFKVYSIFVILYFYIKTLWGSYLLLINSIFFICWEAVTDFIYMKQHSVIENTFYEKTDLNSTECFANKMFYHVYLISKL